MTKDKNLNKISSSWGITTHGVPQGSVLGPLLFLVYINDLPITIRKIAKSIIFADDTSIIITNDNKIDFRNTLHLTMIELSNWFRSNLLSLNYDKTCFLQFLTKKKHNEIQQQVAISNSLITNINSTKFLGLIIDSTMSWKDHVTELTPKLNKACHVIRTLTFLRSAGVLRMVYFSCFHFLCNMVLYFGVTPLTVLTFLKFKKE